MKRLALWLVVMAASLGSAVAQVAVEVVQDQEQFLPGETLMVKVRITNHSGQTLRLGAEDDWLTFAVESREGSIVAKNGEAPVAGEFSLESSKVATKRVDLAPYFSFPQPGRYAVTATVRIKGWDREISSPPKGFNIIEGAKLWDQEFGVPKSGSGTADARPEVRRYILQQANYLKGQLRLYLRLTDANGIKPYRVFPIGPLVSFSRPEPQVDKQSNLHVLYQSGPHSFSYTVFNPDGELLTRQTYDYVGSRPRLRPDQDGKVSVLGGVRRVSPSDVPPPKSEEGEDAPVSSATEAKPPSS